MGRGALKSPSAPSRPREHAEPRLPCVAGTAWGHFGVTRAVVEKPGEDPVFPAAPRRGRGRTLGIARETGALSRLVAPLLLARSGQRILPLPLPGPFQPLHNPSPGQPGRPRPPGTPLSSFRSSACSKVSFNHISATQRCCGDLGSPQGRPVLSPKLGPRRPRAHLVRKGFRQRNSPGAEHVANESGTRVHTRRGLAGQTKLISSRDRG